MFGTKFDTYICINIEKTNIRLLYLSKNKNKKSELNKYVSQKTK